MKGYFEILLIILLSFSTVGYSQICNSDADKIIVTPDLTLPECNRQNGKINLSGAIGGSPPYVFTLNDTVNRTGLFENLPLGQYLAVIEDSRLCSATFVINLQYTDIEKIVRPDNAFTPNGDNLNDTWRIPGIDRFGGSDVRVFNRWGQQVYINSSYSEDSSWDGKQGSSDLPAGTYYYIISIINNCVEEYLSGTVTIIR